VNEVRRYTLSQHGGFQSLDTIAILGENRAAGRVFYAHGNIYYSGPFLDALVLSDSGFVYLKGPVSSLQHDPLLLPNAIARLQITTWDRIELYTPRLEPICTKTGTQSLAAMSSSNYSDKIFMARSNGISGWIPDTSISSYRNDAHNASTIQLNVWPNPTMTGTVNISCKSPIDHIVITDILGCVKYSGTAQHRKNIAISTSGLHSGVYFLAAYASRTMIRKKLVVVQE